MAFTREYLGNNIKALSSGSVTVEDVQVDGDSDLNVRKVDGEKVTIKLPECSYDEKPEDFEFTVTPSSAASKIDGFRQKMLQVFEKYPADLVKEQAPTMLVETNKPAEKKEAVKFADMKQETNVVISKTPVKFSTEFKCSKQELVDALLSKDKVQVWTGSYAEIGNFGPFSIMNGQVSGEVISSEPIKMKWRLKSWPVGVFSEVTIDIKQKEDSTLLELKQTGVPLSEVESLPSAWENMYFNRIKHIFGYLI